MQRAIVKPLTTSLPAAPAPIAPSDDSSLDGRWLVEHLDLEFIDGVAKSPTGKCPFVENFIDVHFVQFCVLVEQLLHKQKRGVIPQLL